MLSIVVPTFCEAGNLPSLTQRLSEVLADIAFELVIADDNSPDETVDVCRCLAESFPLRLIQPTERPRDLARSVIDGIEAATFDRVLVMDADLSHPPEVIPELLKALEATPDAFVLGSRYVPGGSFDRDWSLWRFLNSRVATLLARPLVNCQDPMSGFFLFDRRNVDLHGLRPVGYKIGLEIMLRGRFSGVAEVAIRFADREIGHSKMNLAQQFKYLRHLRRLYLYRYGGLAEFLHFGAVGASGFLIDVSCYFILQWFGVSHLSARAVSFWPAVSWNWALNRLTTFGERTRRPRARQWLEFVGSSLIGFAISWGIYSLLTTQAGFFDRYRVLALIAGVASASLFNFAASSLFVYSDKRKTTLP